MPPTRARSAAAFRRAQALIPGGVNSPARAFGAVGGQPLFIARGEGAHLFDIDIDLYGRHLRVALIDFIRPEQKFAGLEALKAQIAEDAARARAILATIPSDE